MVRLVASLCRRYPFLCRKVHGEVFDIRNMVGVLIKQEELPLPAVKVASLRSFGMLGKQRARGVFFLVLKLQRLPGLVMLCSAFALVMLLAGELSERRGSPEVLADLIILDALVMQGKLAASVQGEHLLIEELLLPLEERGARAAIRTSYAVLASY